jgi:hypothetical protein
MNISDPLLAPPITNGEYREIRCRADRHLSRETRDLPA